MVNISKTIREARLRWLSKVRARAGVVNIRETIREARLRWLGQSKGRCGKHKGDNKRSETEMVRSEQGQVW